MPISTAATGAQPKLAPVASPSLQRDVGEIANARPKTWSSVILPGLSFLLLWFSGVGPTFPCSQAVVLVGIVANRTKLPQQGTLTASGVDSGVDSEMNSGVDSRLDSSVEYGEDSGVDSRIDPGADPRVDSGVDAGWKLE